MLLQTILEIMWDYHVVYMPFYWVLETYNPNALEALKEDFKDYTFESFGAEEMAIIGKIKGRSRFKKEKDLLKLLEQGNICYGIKYKDEIACFSWVSFDGCNLEEYRTSMKDDEAYLFDMYTLKPFRGTNIAAYLRYNIYKTVLEKGPYKFYSITDVYNKSANRFKKKINAKNIKKVQYFRLFAFVYFREYAIP